jgi:thymidylate synthase
MKSASETWLDNLRNIDKNGLEVSPRQLGSKEIISYSSDVSMEKPVVSICARKLSYQFMAAEALWILEGDDRVQPLARHAPSIVRFSDDGKVFFGAYGPQIKPQLDYIIEKFVEDLDTRQAVATIWIRNPKPSLDIPCTISIQWIVRAGTLHCIDTMRSSDLWLGWPYDIFNFTMMTTWIGLKLKEKGIIVDLGNITIQAGSQHLYIKDLSNARKCLTDNSQDDYAPLSLKIFESTPHLKEVLMNISCKSSGDYWLSELQ